MPRTHTAPRILLLGPIEVVGADDTAVPNRRRRLTEIVAYLALHPGGTAHAFDEAIWPGARVGVDTRNSTLSRARRWLGRAPDGEPSVSIVTDHLGYRLHPDVTTDWHDFLTLARRGLTAGDAGLPDLQAAMRLVRGRPFTGIDPRDYTWAEPDIQEMISTIEDVAAALAAGAP